MYVDLYERLSMPCRPSYCMLSAPQTLNQYPPFFVLISRHCFIKVSSNRRITELHLKTQYLLIKLLHWHKFKVAVLALFLLVIKITSEKCRTQHIYKRPQISEIGSLWSSVLDLVDVEILRLFVSSKSKANA